MDLVPLSHGTLFSLLGMGACISSCQSLPRVNSSTTPCSDALRSARSACLLWWRLRTLYLRPGVEAAAELVGKRERRLIALREPVLYERFQLTTV